MRSVRLKLHHNYLASYDHVDRKLQIKEDLITIPKLNALVVRSKLDQTDSEKYIILKAFILESFVNQKNLTAKTNKVFSKKLFFKITLRKDNLFLFLDSCLNTIFLQEYKSQLWCSIQLENKLHFYLDTNLTSNFNIVSTPLRYSLELFNSPESRGEPGKNLSFHLIPTTSTKKI